MSGLSRLCRARSRIRDPKLTCLSTGPCYKLEPRERRAPLDLEPIYEALVSPPEKWPFGQSLPYGKGAATIYVGYQANRFWQWIFATCKPDQQSKRIMQIQYDNDTGTVAILQIHLSDQDPQEAAHYDSLPYLRKRLALKENYRPKKGRPVRPFPISPAETRVPTPTS